jgi:hypothetical protein
MAKKQPDFDVALSFATYVERVASELQRMGLRVFYDKHEAVTLWGRDLYAHLREIYCDRARYTVMFISKHYRRKLWSNHERASAQARAFRERKECILPVRFDGTKIPGVLDTTGYVDLNGVLARRLAGMIKQKLGPIERPNYFPPEPDELWQRIKAVTAEQKDRAVTVAVKLFQAMRLMTVREREIFGTAVLHSCRAKLSDNVHIELEYLSRLARASKQELVATFARLDCLGLTTRIRKPPKYGSHLGESEQVEISYYSSSGVRRGYDNRILSAVFECIADTQCLECVRLALRKLDLSVLSSHTANPATHGKKQPSDRRPNKALEPIG